MNTFTALMLLTATVVQADGRSAEANVSAGMKKFVAGDVAASLEHFDKAAELDADVVPRLWQRGISHYYLGKFQQGRKQFEVHKTVNAHDVENAAWHYLCVAKLEGVEAARKALIQIDTRRDTRVPLKEVYELYAGTGSIEKVLAAAKASQQDRAKMYAHLYVGLYHEVAGDAALARKHLSEAAAVDLDGHYMRDVAVVHLQQRGWNAKEERK